MPSDDAPRFGGHDEPHLDENRACICVCEDCLLDSDEENESTCICEECEDC